jgi:SAM-dependent methyltransferase
VIEQYNPKEYWERRLAKRFSLKGVGHISYSEGYNTWLYRRKKRCIDEFFSGVDLAGKDVLDIGSGTGFFVEWYLARKARVCGIDITQASVSRLAARLPVEVHVADISAAEYRPLRTFDIINMWDVIYHIIDPAAFERSIDNISISMKDGGLFLLTDAFGAPSDKQVAPHVKMRCLRSYDSLAEKGFELVEVRPLYGFLNRTVLNKRLDNVLGRLYFHLDNRLIKVPADNLSLCVWKFRGGKKC